MGSDAKQYSEENGLSKAEWRRARREAAKLIDPETAEVECEITPCIDPYGLEPQLVEEYPHYGREYFARMPGNPVWVSFGDLTAEVSSELLETHFLCHVEPTQEQIDRVERNRCNAEYISIRKEEALRIDPDFAEVEAFMERIGDPYGVKDPDEYYCVGRVYFARRPGSDIWVWFDDLPEDTRDKLWERHKAKLAFPAWLPKGEPITF